MYKILSILCLNLLFISTVLTVPLKLSNEIVDFVRKNPNKQISKRLNSLLKESFDKSPDQINRFMKLLIDVSSATNSNVYELLFENLALNGVTDWKDYLEPDLYANEEYDLSYDADLEDESEEHAKKRKPDRVIQVLIPQPQQRLKVENEQEETEYKIPDIRLERDIVGEIPDSVRVLIQQFKGDIRCEQLGIKRPKAVLFYGPPGCGKTMLAMGLANELQAKFIPISVPSVISKWIGEGAENIKQLFDNARQQAYSGPVVMFLDELDGLGNRDDDTNGSSHQHYSSVTLELQNQLDGVAGKSLDRDLPLYVFAATNKLENLDAALIRSGRFEKIEIPMPSKSKLKLLFEKTLRRVPRNIESTFDQESLLNKCEGLNCADMEFLVDLAARNSFLEAFHQKTNYAEIRQVHFEQALDLIKKSKNLANEIPPELRMTLYS